MMVLADASKKHQHVERRRSDRAEEEEEERRKTIEGNTFEWGQNTEQLTTRTEKKKGQARAYK